MGDLSSSHFLKHRAMGGTSIAAMDENTYSLSNPASYAQLKSFVFETGVSAMFYEVKSNTQKYQDKNYELPYLSFALPLDTTHRWGLNLALTPFSKTGYQSIYKSSGREELFAGSGGFSKFSLGSSIKLFKNFYIGANAGYLFGQQNLLHVMRFDSSTYYDLAKANKLIAGGFIFDAGAIYKAKLGKTNMLQLGITSNIPSSVNARQEVQSYTFFGDVTTAKDSIYNSTKTKGSIDMPMGIGYGIQFTHDNALNRDPNDKEAGKKDNSFTIAADFYQRKWSAYKVFGASDNLRDYMSVSGGIAWKPNSKVATTSKAGSYVRKIQYRAGVKYSQDIYNYNDAPTEQGVSLGFGLPFMSRQSSSLFPSYLDITLEGGQIKGSAAVNPLQQQYFILSVGLHLSEGGWFKRDKID